MVVLCANVYCPFPSNGQPYSKTTDGTTAPNADYHREHFCGEASAFSHVL